MATQIITLNNTEWTRITNFGKPGTCWKKFGQNVVVCSTDQEFALTLPLTNTNVTVSKSKRVPLDVDSGEVLSLIPENLDEVFYGLVIDDDLASIIVDSAILSAAFVFEVKTTAPGETFTLPLEATGTYDFTINHGDGSQSDITVYNQAEITNSYAVAGTHIVKITGQLWGWRFNSLGDKDKIYDIKSLGHGCLRLGNSGGYFYGCSNLTISATDILDLTGTTNLYRCFRGCALLVEILNIDLWDFSLVSIMDQFFYICYSFDQDLGGLNIPLVASMSKLLFGVTISTQNLSDTYVGWAAQPHQNNVITGMGNATYNLAGAEARIALIADGWTITDNGPQSLGPDLLSGWDFTVGWEAGSGVTVDDSDSFTTSLAYKQLRIQGVMTIGKIYEMVITGITSNVRLLDYGASVIYNIGAGIFQFVAVDTGISLQNSAAATTDVITMTIKEIL